MSEVELETVGLHAQYATRLAGDVEANRKEHERVSAEVAALQQRLQELEKDHAALLSMQQALGSPDSAASGTGVSAGRKKKVPAPRGGDRRSDSARPRRATAPRSKGKTGKKATTPASKRATPLAKGPTWGKLIEEYLGAQKEPRSAAEITAALAQAQPKRMIKSTVVRTTVEGLVAKNRVERTKQGSSVFYTVAAPATSDAPQTSAPTS